MTEIKVNNNEVYPYIRKNINGRLEWNDYILLSCQKGGEFSYYKLNKIGGWILFLCNGKNSVVDIEKHICSKFNIDKKYFSSRIRRFLKQLYKYGIIDFSRHPLQELKSFLIGEASWEGINSVIPKIKKISIYSMMSKNFRRLQIPLQVYLRILSCTPTEKVRKIIDEIANSGVLEIAFVGGEASKREDILELIEYGKHKGLKVFLYVKHGNSITKEFISELKKINLDMLEFALYGSNPELHGILGESRYYYQILDNIKFAADVGLVVSIFCKITRSNVKDLRNILKMAWNLGAKKFTMGISRLFTVDIKPFNFWERRYVEIKAKIISIFSSLKIIPLVDCTAGSIYCHIDSEGNIIPCILLSPSMLKNQFGNVLERKLSDIWNGNNFKKFINPRYYGLPCSKCPLPYLPIFRSWPRCRADCRKDIYVSTGDIFSGNRDCWVGRIVNFASSVISSVNKRCT